MVNFQWSFFAPLGDFWQDEKDTKREDPRGDEPPGKRKKPSSGPSEDSKVHCGRDYDSSVISYTSAACAEITGHFSYGGGKERHH